MGNLIKLIITLLITLQVVSAQGVHTKTIAWATPLIQGYGPIKYNPNLAVEPNNSLVYKVIVKTTSPKKKDGVNNKLWHVARLMNLLYASKIKKSNIHIIAVIAGPATSVVLTNKAYKKRFHKNNPDLKLMKELSEHGVKLYVCSQALAEHKIHPNEVNRYTVTTLSAITTLSIFQLKGYALIP